MKSTYYILSIICLFFISCEKNTDDNQDSNTSIKDTFIESNLPNIINLQNAEIESFKKSMQFDSNGNLISWNTTLLKKAYQKEEEFVDVLTFIVSQVGPTPKQITIVNGDGTEEIYYTKLNTNQNPLSKPGLITDDQPIEDIDGDDNTRLYKDYRKRDDGSCMAFVGDTCLYVYR